MRPKTQPKPDPGPSPEARQPRAATAHGAPEDASTTNFSTPESRKKLANEYISILQTPEVKAGKSPRRGSASTPKRQNASIPPRQLPLLGVQIGRYVEQSAARSDARSRSHLCVNIRYVQRTLEIGGLRGGDEHMKIDSSDIAAMEH
ncbi:hypothetical protein H4R19_005391, partial [Coemansia spiralis]